MVHFTAQQFFRLMECIKLHGCQFDNKGFSFNPLAAAKDGASDSSLITLWQWRPELSLRSDIISPGFMFCS